MDDTQTSIPFPVRKNANREPASYTLIILNIVLFSQICVAMWLNPDAVGGPSAWYLDGRRDGIVALILDVIWSRPAGMIAGLWVLINVVTLVSKLRDETPASSPEA